MHYFHTFLTRVHGVRLHVLRAEYCVGRGFDMARHTLICLYARLRPAVQGRAICGACWRCRPVRPTAVQQPDGAPLASGLPWCCLHERLPVLCSSVGRYGPLRRGMAQDARAGSTSGSTGAASAGSRGRGIAPATGVAAAVWCWQRCCRLCAALSYSMRRAFDQILLQWLWLRCLIPYQYNVGRSDQEGGTG